MILAIHNILDAFNLPLKNPILVFSLVLFIILIAPLLFRKLNIPGIIVLIISGVIVGPHGFNVLQMNSAVELFSTIGLLYIMFIAGLDLDLNEFKANKHKSYLFGFFTFIIPLAIGYPICHFVLGYSEITSLLTASMFATHTLISYPIVSRMGISNHQAVAITVGGTILTDTAVLILLAVLVGNSNGTLTYDFWIRLVISISILFLAVFYVIPRIAKWFFKKLESEKHSHYIFVLSVMFFSAFMAEVAGIEPIIGAFIAGLALNKLIPHSSALMNRIEFIGNSLFIPFFLISVGMIVDLSVIFKGYSALIIAAVLTLVALSGKWIAAFLTQISLGYSSIERNLIFGLSSSHAAATLAIILVGYRSGILDEHILNGTVILILATCIVSSIATEKAAKRIIASAEFQPDNQQHIKFNEERILVPIALESSIEKILDLALLIKEKKSLNPISILKVIPNNEDAEIEVIKTKKILAKYAQHTSASETNLEPIATIDFKIVRGIIRTSKEISANYIITGWPRYEGILNKFIGSNTLEKLITQTDKTIFVCKLTHSFISNKRIVLILPLHAEKEYGFNLWFNKLIKLSEELSIPVIIFSDSQTFNNLKTHYKKPQLFSGIKHHPCEICENLNDITDYIKVTDLLFIISARKGSSSYLNFFDELTIKLDKSVPQNNTIIIYPQQFEGKYLMGELGNTQAFSIEKGLDNLQHIKQNIKEIFKKD